MEASSSNWGLEEGGGTVGDVLGGNSYDTFGGTHSFIS